jgi:nucleotide-binding universal stress UspA family protein
VTHSRHNERVEEATMSVVCGTDFSSNAMMAADAAAAIAARLGEPLDLVHVATTLWADVPPSAQVVFMDQARARLEEEVARLRSRHADVRPVLLHGITDDALVTHAARTGARLIVVSSVGRRVPGRWLLGSVAERTAQTASTPVLIVRDAAGLIAWAERQRRLRVLVAVDFSATADDAVRWVAGLGAIGGCDVVVAYSSWPPDERRRLQSPAQQTVFESDPEIGTMLTRELERKVRELPADLNVRVRVETTLGRASSHLVEMALAESADLLVVGTHQRHGAGRLWHGSVSRAVVHEAPMSVACIPSTRTLPREPAPVAPFTSVLAATDFSGLGNRAVPFAYAMVAGGGTVHLMHVLEHDHPHDSTYREESAGAPSSGEPSASPEAEARRALQAFVPPDAAARGIKTEVHVVEAANAAAAIAMAIERLNVDAVSVGTYGRSGLPAMFAGSVTRELLARSRRPVLVIGPARD